MAPTLADRGENYTLEPYFCIFVAHFLYLDCCNYRSSVYLQEVFPKISAQAEINANTNSFV